jgi:hypothetical protein
LIELLKQLKSEGVLLILWTLREDNEMSGNILTQAVEWCKEQGLEFDAINDNVTKEYQMAMFGWTPRKVAADLYIDDRSAFMHNGNLIAFRKFGEQ